MKLVADRLSSHMELRGWDLSMKWDGLLEWLGRILGRTRSETSVSGSREAEGGRTTLHGAMVQLLEEVGPPGLPVGELYHRIVSRDLYRQKNGAEVSRQQVYARLGNYGHLFEVDESSGRKVVRLAKRARP